MSEKRFEVVMNEFDEVEYIMDKVAMEDRDFAEFIDFVEDICNENEQLKQQLLDRIKYTHQLEAELKKLNKKIEALEDANTGLVETIAHFNIEEVL